jgi:hypothetical protein
MTRNRWKVNNELKRKIRFGAGIMIAFLLIAIAGVVYYILLGQWHTAAYAAGNSNTVNIYKVSESGEETTVEPVGTVIRGSKVTRHIHNITSDGVTYYKVKSDAYPGEKDLYMAESSLAGTVSATVQETEVFVRTPATIYESAEGPDIASFAPKGTKLEITGHDTLLDNGYIDMYKVRYQNADGKEAEGYVYGKYMTGTQEEADKPYNEHGEYDTAAGDGFRFELYGGEAKDLDFYPYERTSIEGNEFCRYARAMYLNAVAAISPD